MAIYLSQTLLIYNFTIRIIVELCMLSSPQMTVITTLNNFLTVPCGGAQYLDQSRGCRTCGAGTYSLGGMLFSEF